jgi:hypothetical protein
LTAGKAIGFTPPVFTTGFVESYRNYLSALLGLPDRPIKSKQGEGEFLFRKYLTTKMKEGREQTD